MTEGSLRGEGGDSTERAIEHAVALACRVVASTDARVVRSARVVGGRRLSGIGLLALQTSAHERGLRLTMDETGTVAVRHEMRPRDEVDGEMGEAEEACSREGERRS